MAGSAPAMLASKETVMSRLAELGIAKRLGLIVAAGVAALTGLAVISIDGQDVVAKDAQKALTMEACLGALNHLDTRQSELKTDAYRAALGQDVAGDVTDDVQSSAEAADAVAGCGLPSGMAATFGTNRADFTAFSAFITDFASSAANNATS